MVQQQADGLESENRKLKSLRAVGGGPSGVPVASGGGGGAGGGGSGTPKMLGHSSSTGGSTPRNSIQMGGGGNDMPLVAAAAMTTMNRALRHIAREVSYWRSKATKQGLLHGLKPLAVQPMFPRPGSLAQVRATTLFWALR